eukprot:XP_013996687.1 PREDICTED: probable helicase senataxin [Salmo salar]
MQQDTFSCGDLMSMCRWCTSLGDDVAKLLQRYCAGSWLTEDEEAVNEEKALNDDLDKCLECVVAYHRAKEELPGLHREAMGVGDVQAPGLLFSCSKRRTAG